ncbi:sel1 repeat family protein [Pelistega sp. NLN82]|uniref:Sel1 repeat family protein n=1 Tax=Pelistega ratti TaxID=2652177 RepID=A0A6L9Y448_9BURK|nr:tetratricopeptide repeat protein [Pelistega ratti]NEN75209.1 sel1 repeat family protein [Pelistega ratti]
MNKTKTLFYAILFGLSALIIHTLTYAAQPHKKEYISQIQPAVNAYQRGNYQKAFQLLLPLAKQGNYPAQSILAQLYYEGKGVRQDYQQAFEWIQKAAMHGDSEDQYKLALLYLNGQGIKQDYQQAFQWYEKAARQGNAYAQHNLGFMK